MKYYTWMNTIRFVIILSCYSLGWPSTIESIDQADALDILLQFQSISQSKFNSEKTNFHSNLFDTNCVKTIGINSEKSFTELLRIIEEDSLLKIPEFKKPYQREQKYLCITYFEFKFHTLVAMQFRLEALYQDLDSEDKLYFMANYFLHKKEISKHKTELFLKILDFYSKNDQLSIKQRITNGVKRILYKTDLKLSETGNQVIQRSPYGIMVERGKIDQKLCQLLEQESNPEAKNLLVQISEQIKTEKKKYKKHPDYNIVISMSNIKEITIPPPDPSKTFFLEAFDAQTHSEKIKLYSKSIDHNPKFAPSYFNRAISFRELSQWQPAISDFSKALDLEPDLIEAYIYRGICFHNIKNFPKAIVDYNEVLKKDPTNSTAFLNRAISYQQLEQFALAIEDYTMVIKLDCNNITAQINRGYCYRKIGQDQNALSDFKDVLSLNPKNTTALYNLGILYWQKKEWSTVIQYWEKCLEIDPHHESVLDNLPTAKVNYEIAKKNKYGKKTTIIKKR